MIDTRQGYLSFVSVLMLVLVSGLVWSCLRLRQCCVCVCVVVEIVVVIVIFVSVLLRVWGTRGLFCTQYGSVHDPL